jgi:hypothetical protein
MNQNTGTYYPSNQTYVDQAFKSRILKKREKRKEGGKEGGREGKKRKGEKVGRERRRK